MRRELRLLPLASPERLPGPDPRGADSVSNRSSDHGPHSVAHQSASVFADHGTHSVAHQSARVFADHGPYPVAHQSARVFANYGPHPIADAGAHGDLCPLERDAEANGFSIVTTHTTTDF